MVNIKHREQAVRRKSSVIKGKSIPSPMSVQRGETLYTRKSGPGDSEDIS